MQEIAKSQKIVDREHFLFLLLVDIFSHIYSGTSYLNTVKNTGIIPFRNREIENIVLYRDIQIAWIAIDRRSKSS